MALEGVKILCFWASYALALLVELANLLNPRPWARWIANALGGAGLAAHTIFLFYHPPALSSNFGSLVFLTWILAVFYLYGSIHYRRSAWGVFVLPLILSLLALAAVDSSAVPASGWQLWRFLHYALLLLAAVGVCVGFVASLMYLLQAQRLKAKALTSDSVRLLSLERLEAMNRRAINLAFPLLTAGVLIGLALMNDRSQGPTSWTDPRILGGLLLWLLFAVVLYLRYAVHLPGRRLAVLTIVAFGLLLFTLASTHTSVAGGSP
jgi:ABC-type transport system involved in cytochrome c biogenesis permease subunit